MKKLIWIHSMRDFLLLWSSQAVSSLGSAMTSFALIIWVYQQEGTATSVALLSFFTYLPSILLSFIAGTLADKWDKKRIMLTSDLVAALGTIAVFVLLSMGNLEIWHLYLVNFMISLMNAFQGPAAYVSTSLLVPKDQYVRASGLQAFSGALVTILTPSLAPLVLAFGGLKTVLTLDLASFLVAFLVLLFLIKIPKVEAASEAEQSFARRMTDGLRFLKAHRALLHLILLFAFVNLIAYMTGLGILPALILARTGGDEVALGIVSAAVGIGTLVGSLLVTIQKPFKSRVRVVLISCALSFALHDPAMAIGRTLPIWIAAAFLGNAPLPFLGANLTAIMRETIPIELQGRVFSTRDTLQYSTIPLGLFLGGYLADNVFEPLMQASPPALLAALVGTEKGSGIALMFLLSGVIGLIACLWSLKDPVYKDIS